MILIYMHLTKHSYFPLSFSVFPVLFQSKLQIYLNTANTYGDIIARRRLHIHVISTLVNLFSLKYWRVWLGFFSPPFEGNTFVTINIKVSFDNTDDVKTRINIKMHAAILVARTHFFWQCRSFSETTSALLGLLN